MSHPTHPTPLDKEDKEDEVYEDEEGLGPPGVASLGTAALFPRKAQPHQAFCCDSGPPHWVARSAWGPAQLSPEGFPILHLSCSHQTHWDWTYEEQVKQLYELDADSKGKEFLDDLFSFMQKRGTPVNRIPIVESSAAFTLRTQYVKYLYPQECEKRGLSNPNKLQAAIDSNWREGWNQSFGGSLFAYSPAGAHSMLSSPKLPVSSLGLATSINSSSITPAPKVAAAQAGVAAQAAALERLREKLEYGEPPEKKTALLAEEQQRLMQRALQQNFLALTAQLPMSIRIHSQASESRQDSAVNLTSTNGSESIGIISATRYIMNGTLIFLLGTPNNNLGPITLASPPWTSCSSQPPNMLVKNLNLLNSPLTFQPLGKRSRPCST
ncbi:hypothetical protein JEQ12_000585 [Ovis aries]|uniref:AT-rich interactive domain-containing protein 3 n=1 Tax=Ovis aries TaxID=9940 RepID=A0A836ALQ5_SHEEP|nr:hypothetical protein JEQ12_000585 [Ovis aries]